MGRQEHLVDEVRLVEEDHPTRGPRRRRRRAGTARAPLDYETAAGGGGALGPLRCAGRRALREWRTARGARRLGARPAPVGSATRPSYGPMQRDVFATSYYVSKQATEASAAHLAASPRRDLLSSARKILANWFSPTNRSSGTYAESRAARETPHRLPKISFQHSTTRCTSSPCGAQSKLKDRVVAASLPSKRSRRGAPVFASS